MAQNKPYEHSIYKKKIPKKSSGWEKSMMKKKLVNSHSMQNQNNVLV